MTAGESLMEQCLRVTTVCGRAFKLARARACYSHRNARDRDASSLLSIFEQFGLWLSLVERCVRDAEAVGSNPTSPTPLAHSLSPQ